MKKVNLFFIGSEFYDRSGTRMSSIYEVNTKKRWDWGLVGAALRDGDKVTIRPATDKELVWATRLLNGIQTH